MQLPFEESKNRKLQKHINLIETLYKLDDPIEVMLANASKREEMGQEV